MTTNNNQIQHVIGIASGKGGVGKSTCAVNIGIALRRQGATVGLLDADIYGPNIPMMLGASGSPRVNKDNQVQPTFAYGIKTMSMGFVLKPDQAVVWRGPMVHNALEQLLGDVAWGELDYLLIDLPPGTGDVQLSLTQLIPFTGAVIITTPQDVALDDVRKGMTAFQEMNVPLLGIVENMSYFCCPHCDTRTDIFSHGGGRRTAKELDISFLGEVALDPAIRAGGDDGQPITAVAHHSPQAESFMKIAEEIAAKVATLNRNPKSANTIQLTDISIN